MSKEELLARIKHNHVCHPADTEQKRDNHEAVRDWTYDCAEALIDVCPEGRELFLALTKLEEAMFWANAAIARHG